MAPPAADTLAAAADRAQIISLGEDLPKLWDAASVVERKQILRLIVKEVVLDQRPESGQVWIRIIWQTGHSPDIHVGCFISHPPPAPGANAVETFFARLTAADCSAAYSLTGRLAGRDQPISPGEHNRKPKPFVWTADPNHIIEKINRAPQLLASDHSDTSKGTRFGFQPRSVPPPSFTSGSRKYILDLLYP